MVAANRISEATAPATFATRHRLAEPAKRFLAPARIARFLGLRRDDLARLSGVSRNTLTRAPQSPKVQARLAHILRVLKSAEESFGNADEAVLWFKFEPLADYDYKQPIDLVAEGHADAVLACLERLRDDVYA